MSVLVFRAFMYALPKYLEDIITSNYLTKIGNMLCNVILLMSSDLICTAGMVYAIFYRMVLYYNHCIIERQIKYLMRKKFDPMAIFRNLKMGLRVIETFDNLFNILPFIWLSYSFLSCAYSVLFLQKYQNDILNQVIFVMHFVGNNTTIFTIVWWLNREQKCLKEKCEKLQERLIEKILNQSDLSQTLALTVIDKISNSKTTVFSFFDFDKNLLPSFVGTLLTFTVLFLQLNHSIVTS
jgi:hypothetical protein